MHAGSHSNGPFPFPTAPNAAAVLGLFFPDLLIGKWHLFSSTHRGEGIIVIEFLQASV